MIAWDVRELRAALAKDTKLNDSMKHVLVGNLVEQLLQRYKATQHAQQKQELIDQQDRLRGLQGRRKSLRWTVTQSMREMNEPGAEPRTEQPEVKQQGAGGATSNRPDAQFHDSFEQLRRRTEANAIVTEVAERNKGDAWAGTTSCRCCSALFHFRIRVDALNERERGGEETARKTKNTLVVGEYQGDCYM